MNKLLIVLYLASLIHLEAVEWMSLDDGLAKAQKSHKLIMIDVVRDRCHFCVNMDKNVFDDKKISQWIHSCFIPVKLNLSHQKLPNGFKVEVTPSFLFMNEKLELIKKIQGSWDSKDFQALSKNLCKDN